MWREGFILNARRCINFIIEWVKIILKLIQGIKEKCGQRNNSLDGERGAVTSDIDRFN